MLKSIATQKLPIDQINHSTLARVFINGVKRAVVIEHAKFLLVDEDSLVVVSVLGYDKTNGKYDRVCHSVPANEVYHF